MIVAVSSRFSRRSFLAHAGGVLFVASAGSHPLGRLAGRAAAAAGGAPPPTFRIVRGDDQLDVLVELVDVAVVGDQLVGNGPAPLVRLTFGPQHTAEAVLATGAAVPTAAVDGLTSGA